MSHVLMLIFLMSSTSSFAYNWRRCKAKTQVFKPEPDKPLSGNILEDVFGTTSKKSFDLTVNKSVGFSVSATSFVTSTGPCKAFGMANELRTRYIAHTAKELQLELARGNGEYLTTLASLYGCNDHGRTHFNGILRNEHERIFNGTHDITSQITEVVLTQRF